MTACGISGAIMRVDTQVISSELGLHLLVDLLDVVFTQLSCQRRLVWQCGACTSFWAKEVSYDSWSNRGIDILGQPTTRPAESPASADLGIM